MFRRTLTFAAALPLIMLTAGCEGEPEAEITQPSASSPADPVDVQDPVDPQNVPGVEPSTPPPRQTEPGTVSGADAQNIRLEMVEPDGLDALVARNEGKVVLFDFWATWCVPCVTQFPHTVELSKQYPEDLVVYAVSMNDTDEETLADIKEFYADHGPGNVRTLVSSEGGADEAYTGFEITEGALPHYKVYGRDGKLVRSFGGDINNPLDPEQIDTTIVEAIGK